MSEDERVTVWFGPPGVGKSTFVRRNGGLDLELIASGARDEYNKMIVNMVRQKLTSIKHIGAADTQPEDYDSELFRRVLVLPSRDKYNARRKARDELYPEKASQGDYYDSFASNASRYDEVVDDFPAPTKTSYLTNAGG